MSKAGTGLFGGTQGANKATARKSAKIYLPTESLRNHIENVEASSGGKAGIKGAHNKDNFLREIDRIGAHTISTTPNPHLDGVERISYQMPKRDKTGKPTGEYQSRTHDKTVYDPVKISTNKYIKWGLEAANNAAKKSSSGKLGREWTGTDSNGVKWHGYCDDSGNITSFYPDD
jgi:hypothetical protein